MTDNCLQPITPDTRQRFYNLYQFYIYDLSDCIDRHPGESGFFDLDISQFNAYWQGGEQRPYFIVDGEQVAGFCLLRKLPPPIARYDIEQFFVLNSFKRRQLGLRAFQQLARDFPGPWQIRALTNNDRALTFWRQAIAQVVGHEVDPVIDDDHGRPMFFFHFDC